jgi:hypothetical protein
VTASIVSLPIAADDFERQGNSLTIHGQQAKLAYPVVYVFVLFMRGTSEQCIVQSSLF